MTLELILVDVDDFSFSDSLSIDKNPVNLFSFNKIARCVKFFLLCLRQICLSTQFSKCLAGRFGGVYASVLGI